MNLGYIVPDYENGHTREIRLPYFVGVNLFFLTLYIGTWEERIEPDYLLPA
jgi:hypothetical protein